MAESQAVAAITSFFCLRRSTASSGETIAPGRRAFTSTKATVSPVWAMISTSPWRQRQFRASIRYPWRRSHPAV